MLLYISFCVYGAGSCSIVSSALQSIIIFTLGARSLNIYVNEAIRWVVEILIPISYQLLYLDNAIMY